METVLTYAPLLSLLSAFGFVAYLIVVFITKLVKHRNVAVAIKETATVACKTVEVVDNNTIFLELREMCKEGIYSVEQIYKSYNGKAGVFKLDSLLKDLKVACMEANVVFDRSYWIDYINKEVAKMKEVK